MEFNVLETVDNLLVACIYLVVSFLLFIIGKKVYQLIHRDVNLDDELVEKDNLAFSVSHVGYYIGLVLVILGVYSGDGFAHLVEDLILVGIYGLLSIALLNISVLLSDKFILKKYSLKKEVITDQNVGAGVIEAAFYISNGLILHGVMAGNEDSFVEVLILWLIAQLVFAIVAWVYNKILPYDMHEHVEKDNIAVGVGFAGALIAIANLVRFGIQMEADNWIWVGENLLLETGIGLLMLPIARLLTDRILLPKRRLTDEIIHQEKPNIGVAIIEAFAYIGGSLLICASFS